MSICGSFYRNVQAIVLRSVCLDNDFAGRRTFLLSLDNNDGGRKAAPSVNQSYNQRPALADAMSIPIVNSGT